MGAVPNVNLARIVTEEIGQTNGCARTAVNLDTTRKSAHHWNDNEARTMSEIQTKPKFVAVKDFVYRGGSLICRAVSHTMARRIANALNVYKTREKGY